MISKTLINNTIISKIKSQNLTLKISFKWYTCHVMNHIFFGYLRIAAGTAGATNCFGASIGAINVPQKIPLISMVFYDSSLLLQTLNHVKRSFASDTPVSMS
jgi:hypothetical protein